MSKKLIFLTSFVLVLALAGTNVVFAGRVWEDRIHGENDDVEESGSGSMYMDSGDLEMPDGQVIGLRFSNVSIPPGAIISNAYVQFQCDETKSGTEAVSLLIEGDLSPDAALFADVTNNVTSRPRTTAKVVWVPADWTSVGQRDQTSDIASVIEEIVGQPGWAIGNSLVLIISDDPANPSTGIRCAEAGPGSDSAMLHIEFTSKRATEPSPADGVIIDNTWATLYWTPGVSAASHDVYFGENSVDVDAGTPDSSVFLGNLADACLIVGYPGYPYPDGLVSEVTYYWRIDEVEADGTTIHKGPLWRFAVRSSTTSNPDPANGTRAVDPDVVLSWSPGLDAKLRTVYFGESFDEVSSATGGMLQGAATYTPTPSPLAERTVYYWRVDEFDGVETYKGDVWSFRTSFIADPNLIGWWTFDEGQGTGALDSSGYNNHGTIVGNPQWVEGIIGGALYLDGSTYVAIDGVADDITGSDITLSAWVNTTDGDCEVIACNTWGYGNVVRWVIDGGKAAIDDSAPEGHSSKTVSDGKWHMLTYTRKEGTGYIYVDGIREGMAPAVYSFASTNLWSIGQEWDSGGPSGFWPGTVDDVRIYNTALTADEIKQIMRGDAQLAWNPSPHNNTTVDIDRASQPLTWSPGEDAAQHDVYFGTNELAVEVADTSDTTGVYRNRQTAASYNVPEALEWGTGPYYWRIDEYSTDALISTGRVWNFTVADYLIVDDFEDYNDYPPDEIWSTWVDGYGIPINGATVGYPDPDWNAGEHYVETTIVHGGAQAMPFFYSNTGTAAYSEGTRTFAVPQNWTQEGVQTLVLYFYGTAGNTGQLYVKVSGVKVAYPGNAADIEQVQWNQWSIDLASFGVSLQNVRNMSIGIDGSGASGTLYFDDIRLYRVAP